MSLNVDAAYRVLHANRVGPGVAECERDSLARGVALYFELPLIQRVPLRERLPVSVRHHDALGVRERVRVALGRSEHDIHRVPWRLAQRQRVFERLAQQRSQ